MNQDSERASEREALTLWRAQRKVQVRTRKKVCERARGAHNLESAVGKTSQDGERKKLVSERGALTNWRTQMEGQVRKAKES